MFGLSNRKIHAFIKDERGDFGLKGLIITVAIIVVVGCVVLFLTGKNGSGGQMETWIGEVWDSLGGWLTNKIGIGW
jgi:Flp pilus assembly pilin Flp